MQTGTEAHPASCTMGIAPSFPPSRWLWHLLPCPYPSSAEDERGWSCTFTTPQNLRDKCDTAFTFVRSGTIRLVNIHLLTCTLRRRHKVAPKCRQRRSLPQRVKTFERVQILKIFIHLHYPKLFSSPPRFLQSKYRGFLSFLGKSKLGSCSLTSTVPLTLILLWSRSNFHFSIRFNMLHLLKHKSKFTSTVLNLHTEKTLKFFAITVFVSKNIYTEYKISLSVKAFYWLRTLWYSIVVLTKFIDLCRKVL
jgi:hypothetical protein